tara:strand:+ start:159 stop:293 length:135 start_codon:yes stop_codon:yes gene_type:complete
MMEVIIRLTCEEKPTVQDVLDYINELGEELDFEIVERKEKNNDN